VIRRAPAARIGYTSAGWSGAEGAMRLVREARAHLSRIGLTAQVGGDRIVLQVRPAALQPGRSGTNYPPTDS